MFSLEGCENRTIKTQGFCVHIIDLKNIYMIAMADIYMKIILWLQQESVGVVHLPESTRHAD